MSEQETNNYRVTERLAPLPNTIEVSSSVDELISGNPGLVVRYGTVIISAILCLLIAGMYFIKYPDTLEGAAILTTDPLPIRLKSNAGGRLLRLFVIEGATIGKDMPVAELENNTGYDNALVLSNMADSTLAALDKKDIVKLGNITRRQVRSMGEAQIIYNSLIDAISVYVLEQNQHILVKRSAGIKSQTARYQSMAVISQKEKNMIAEEVKQADDRFASNEALYKDKVISRQEYYDEAARLRQKKLALEQQSRAYLQNNISIADNNKQLMDIQYEQQEKENSQVVHIREEVRNIQNFIQSWKLKYLLFAPYNGKIHFAKPFQVNETISSGEEIGAIVPSAFHYIAYVYLPATGSGKIKPGQKAHLMLDQFPYNEFGYLEGTVRSIDAIPQEGKSGLTYRIVILLPAALITSHHRSLSFNAEMTGTARIITKDRNLLQRITDGVAGWQK